MGITYLINNVCIINILELYHNTNSMNQQHIMAEEQENVILDCKSIFSKSQEKNIYFALIRFVSSVQFSIPYCKKGSDNLKLVQRMVMQKIGTRN